VVLCAPMIRLGEWELMRWTAAGIPHRFETVADAIAVGCVLAGTRAWLHGRREYMRVLSSPLFVCVPAAILAADLLHDHPVVYFGAVVTIVNVGTALCVDWCVTVPEGRVGAMLNARPLVFVGLLSYSLYLWQQLFLNRASAAPLASFPINIALASVVAVVSYFLVEQPALRLRRRIERALDRRRVQGTVGVEPAMALGADSLISHPPT
jgi:peptidoglycan/LPS O-acetylase OafA/YrhL